MKKSALKLNIGISLLCRPISMILSYIYVPIVLTYLGTEKYGVWSTILTILSWIGNFDIGIGNGLRNQLTVSINKHDGRANKLVSSAYTFLSIFMVVVVTIFSIIASKLNWNKIFGIKGPLKENLAFVVWTSVFFVAVNFVISLCKNVLYALQQAANVSLIELCTQVLNIIGVLIIMNYMDSNLFMMACVYGCSMIISNSVASIILYSKKKDLKPNIKCANFEVGKDLTKMGLQFFSIQICAMVLYTTDSLIISYMFGAEDVTPYSTVNKLFHAIIVVFTTILTPIWSSVSKSQAQNDWNRVKRLLNKLYLLMIPFFCGTVLLMIIFRPLSGLWLRQELEYENGLIVFGALYCMLTIWCNTHSTFTNGLGMLRIPQAVAVVQAVINIPLSIFLATIMGLRVTGILAGTVLTMIIPAIVLPIITNNRIRKEIVENELNVTS